MRFYSIVSVLALAVALEGCATAKEDLKGATLTPMGNPVANAPPSAASLVFRAHEEPQAASPNSIWRAGARTFFNDQRASKVGDILTVLITIDDSAQVTNDTAHERKTSNTMNLGNLFGLESTLGRVLPKAFAPATALNVGADSAMTGTGSINRADKINLTIGAVVVKVMPNGNLVVEGRQEVKTNAEVRELTVTGLVRPEDITASNTINHTQIAEARISYGGRGDLTRTQRSPGGQALLESFSPF